MPAPTKTLKRTGRINVTAAAAKRVQEVIPWDRLIDEFLEKKEHLGKSDNTVRYYRQRLNSWIIFLRSASRHSATSKSRR